MTKQKVKAPSKVTQVFSKFSTAVTKLTGKPVAFILSVLLVVVWALTGPVFHYSEAWQLVINTGTTIITFWMVFVIQHSQNKDTMALQLKLNELIAASERASNRLISAEELSDAELEILKKFYTQLATMSKEETDFYSSHSIDEAKRSHERKSKLAEEPNSPAGEVVEQLDAIDKAQKD